MLAVLCVELGKGWFTIDKVIDDYLYFADTGEGCFSLAGSGACRVHGHVHVPALPSL